jgi:hypothetical protein
MRNMDSLPGGGKTLTDVISIHSFLDPSTVETLFDACGADEMHNPLRSKSLHEVT